jgi:hypothetical protein
MDSRSLQQAAHKLMSGLWKISYVTLRKMLGQACGPRAPQIYPNVAGLLRCYQAIIKQLMARHDGSDIRKKIQVSRYASRRMRQRQRWDTRTLYLYNIYIPLLYILSSSYIPSVSVSVSSSDLPFLFLLPVTLPPRVVSYFSSGLHDCGRWLGDRAVRQSPLGGRGGRIDERALAALVPNA